MQKYTAPVDEDDPDLGMVSPTLSAGIAVCHHIEPFSDALELARKAEKQAKSVPGKDALAVTVSKRSGVDRTVVGQWLPDTELDAAFADKWGTLDRRLKQFMELHRKDEFPDGAAYELHDLYLRVGQTLPPEALQAEVIRILKRKRAQHGDTTISKDVVKDIAYLLSLSDRTLAQLADELIIAREFARASNLADEPLAKEHP
jgi:CRISPR-associated protein Cmr2